MHLQHTIGFALLGAAISSGLVCAQTVAPLRFEVAAIKRHSPAETSSRISLVNGGVDAINVTLLSLIRQAYGVQEYQIMNAPKWVTDTRWDIQARTPDFVLTVNENDIPGPERVQIRDQMLERMRNLLADRFHLATHEEMKEQAIYALGVSKGGPRLAPTKGGTGVDIVDVRGNGGRALATYTGATMDTLARSLASRMGRPVINQTGLSGYFDFKLEWATDSGQPGASDGGADSDAPTIFTALPEQIGLRLEAQRAPAKIVVIERIEFASEN